MKLRTEALRCADPPPLTVIQHQGTDALADLRSARFTGPHHAVSGLRQPLLQQAQLGRFACAFAALRTTNSPLVSSITYSSL